jgi:hypothetical protein
MNAAKSPDLKVPSDLKVPWVLWDTKVVAVIEDTKGVEDIQVLKENGGQQVIQVLKENGVQQVLKEN